MQAYPVRRQGHGQGLVGFVIGIVGGRYGDGHGTRRGRGVGVGRNRHTPRRAGVIRARGRVVCDGVVQCPRAGRPPHRPGRALHGETETGALKRSRVLDTDTRPHGQTTAQGRRQGGGGVQARPAQGEVGQAGQVAELAGYPAGEVGVVGQMQFFELGQAAQGRRDGPAQLVVGEDDGFELGRRARVRDGPAQLVVVEVEPEEVGRRAQVRDGPAQLVVGEEELAEVGQLAQVRDRPAQPVVVEME